MPEILDGKELAQKIRSNLKIKELKMFLGILLVN